MNGYFRKRNNKWSYTIDVGTDPTSFFAKIPKNGLKPQKKRGSVIDSKRFYFGG